MLSTDHTRADAPTLQEALDERRETRRDAALLRPLERGAKDVFPSIEDIRPEPRIFPKIRRFGVLS